VSRSRAEKSTKAAKTAFSASAVLLVGALVWLLVGVPALVKYPTDLKASPKYAGTFNVLVNPTTYAPLPEPTKLPLTIDRHIEVIDSSSSRAVVAETIHQKAGTLVDSTQRNQYVMDRRTLKNVKDPRAWAFEASNVVDRSGTYRLNLPFDTKSDGDYAIWKNEFGKPYEMQGVPGDSTSLREGLTLQNHRGAATDVPITDAYFKELTKSLPLPTSLTLDQLKPQLAAAGFDVDAVLPALLPKLSAADAATLATLAAKPIPLQYVMSFDGRASVEPRTGAEVVVGATESLGIKPNSPDLPAIRALLQKYGQVPEAVTAATALDKLASSSIPVVSYTYEQTPASVRTVAAQVKDMRRQVILATVWVPSLLAGLAGVALLVGAWSWPRGPRAGRARGRVGAPRPVRT
jgi:hypothetical protein